MGISNQWEPTRHLQENKEVQSSMLLYRKKEHPFCQNQMKSYHLTAICVCVNTKVDCCSAEFLKNKYSSDRHWPRFGAREESVDGLGHGPPAFLGPWTRSLRAEPPGLPGTPPPPLTVLNQGTGIVLDGVKQPQLNVLTAE